MLFSFESFTRSWHALVLFPPRNFLDNHWSILLGCLTMPFRMSKGLTPIPNFLLIFAICYLDLSIKGFSSCWKPCMLRQYDTLPVFHCPHLSTTTCIHLFCHYSWSSYCDTKIYNKKRGSWRVASTRCCTIWTTQYEAGAFKGWEFLPSGAQMFAAWKHINASTIPALISSEHPGFEALKK